MAYVNVAEWSPEQVCDWIRGLENCMTAYTDDLLENKVNGRKLLQLTPDLLFGLGVKKIGHQELLLQAIRHLRNIHYHLDQETLQNLALRLGSKARSIYNELQPPPPPTPVNGGGSTGEEDDNSTDEDDRTVEKNSSNKVKLVSTEVVAGVADCLFSVKAMVSWLNRTPFEGVESYDKLKNEMVELSIRLATIAQRDQFAEDQGSIIRENCHTLSVMTDQIIQTCNDPLIIQPASLDVATIKKKTGDDLGVHLSSSYDGVHQVSYINPLSPAHTCGKLSEGDHLIQINYQTVIGWLPDKVLSMLYENHVEVILTIRKQPRHASGSTQIYFKPFRLPSKKRSYNHGYSPANDFTFRNNYTNLNLYSFLDNHHLQVSKLQTPKKDNNSSKNPPSSLHATSQDCSSTTDSPKKDSVLTSPSSREDIPTVVTFAADSTSCDSPLAASFTVGGLSVPAVASPDSSSCSSSAGMYVTAPSSSASPPNKAGIGAATTPPALSENSDTIMDMEAESMEEEDDAFLSSDSDEALDNEDAVSTSASVRLYPPKPRAIVHRRATIPGDSAAPGITPNTLNRYIEGLRVSGLALRSTSHSRNSNTSQSSANRDYHYLRTPSDHMNRLRPHTTIGGDSKGTKVPLGPSSLPPASQSDVRKPSISNGGNEDTGLPLFHLPLTITSPPTPLTPKPPSTPHTPNSGLMAGRRVSEDRPKLDKSHSTPAYDFGANGLPGGTEGEDGVFTYTNLLPTRNDSNSSKEDSGHPGNKVAEDMQRDNKASRSQPSESIVNDRNKLPENTVPSPHRNMPLAKLKDQATFYCNEQSFGDSVFYCSQDEDSNKSAILLAVPTGERTKKPALSAGGSLLTVPPPERSKSPLLERRTPGAVRPSNLDIKSASIEERVFFPVIIEKPSQIVSVEQVVKIQETEATKTLDKEEDLIPTVSNSTPDAVAVIVKEEASTDEQDLDPAPPSCFSSIIPNNQRDKPREVTSEKETKSTASPPEAFVPTDAAATGDQIKRKDLFKTLRQGVARTYEHFSSKETKAATVSPQQCSSNTSNMFDIVSSLTSRFYSGSSSAEDSAGAVPCAVVPTTPDAIAGVTQKTVPPRKARQLSLTFRSAVRRCVSSSPSLWRRGMLFTHKSYVSRDSKGRRSSLVNRDASMRRSTCGVCGGGRGVACRELGVGDHQGWLYRRAKAPPTIFHSQTWHKKWFILKRGYLYGYAHTSASKAESLIYLPGFHVCPAQDVKTKKFAFKIYHANGTTFYFACDSSEERSRWMSEMGLSAISSSKCSDSGGSPSPPLLSRHDEEAYFSETDDEADLHCDLQASQDVSIGTSRGEGAPRESMSTGSGLSSLFHWGSSGQSKGSSAPSSGGMKLFQSKHMEAVPSTNFRSYKRVRDNIRSTSTSDLCSAAHSTSGAAQSSSSTTSTNAPSTNPVSRKGSLREKLRNHLPAALSLDRRKRNGNKNEKDVKNEGVINREKKLKEVIKEEERKKDDEEQEEENKENRREDNKRLSTGSTDSQPITPLKCKLINHSSSGDSPAGYKTEASHKSWMCNLKSSQTHGYSSSRYTSGNRVSSSQSSSSPNTPKTPKNSSDSQHQLGLNKSLSGTFSEPRQSSVERLKRTDNYRPVTLKSGGRGDRTMHAAFSMGLDENYKKDLNKSKSSSFLDSSSYSSSSPSSSAGLRPAVPPRTKFLSPGERISLEQQLRNDEQLKNPLKYSSSCFSSSTSIATVRPTMGVAMIGKQRRTPGVLSPREVFFCSPPPSPSPITPHQHAYFPNTTLASTATFLPSNNSSTPVNSRTYNSRLPTESTIVTGYDGKPMQVLPHYPNMEYPPTFEPSSYSISASSLSSSSGSILRGAPNNISSSAYSINNSSGLLNYSPFSSSYCLPNNNSSLSRSSNVHSNTSTGEGRNPNTPLNNNKNEKNKDSEASKPPWSASPRPPMPNPRTFTPNNNASSNQYCNLEDFSAPPLQPSTSPGGGVVVGISCNPQTVVSHHHSIYITSPALPPRTPPRRKSTVEVLRQCDVATTSTLHRSADDLLADDSTAASPLQPSLKRKSSGGSMFTPHRSDSSLSSTYQHGGRSGGTVIASTWGDSTSTPPNLVLPPPPRDPPPP